MRFAWLWHLRTCCRSGYGRLFAKYLGEWVPFSFTLPTAQSSRFNCPSSKQLSDLIHCVGTTRIITFCNEYLHAVKKTLLRF